MKTRNGFVSNSSSSSFVVAFPREPKCFEDVYDMMFDSKEGGISVYDMGGMSHTQIAQRVWDDIKTENKNDWDYKRIPATKKDIQEEFSCRYYYTPSNHNVFWLGRKDDEFGGAWSYEINEYFGNDKKTMDEFRDFTIKIEKEEQNIQKMQRKIMEGFKLKRPPYAYKGGKHQDTGKPYTAVEIKKYNKYEKELDKFRKENEEYQALEKKLRDIWDKKYKKRERLRNKLAKVDADVFIKKNNNAFLAIFSYDDDFDCTLEHGDIFRNLTYVRISHH